MYYNDRERERKYEWALSCKTPPRKVILAAMRKPVLPRVFIFLLLYCVVFVLLVSVQFAKKGSFTQRVSNFVVTGHYRLPGENDTPQAQNEYLLDGETHVFFGGIDFSMIRGTEGHSLRLTGNGEAFEALPERMTIAGDSVVFTFPGGTELDFSTQYSGGSLEMRIAAVFSEDVTALELPFKPLRKTGIHDSGDGQFIVSADGENYSFGRSPIDLERRVILIKAGAVPVSYRVIPERKTLSPDDFILSRARTAEAYNEELTKWRDQNFSLWNRTISTQNNEDVVAAFGAEALIRGTYKAAVAAVPAAFLRGSNRSYESSVYLGNLDQAYRSLVTRERENMARLSRQINEKSLEFLKEPRVFRYFAIRGYPNFMNAGADLVRTIDPAILALDITPGILEGFVDWKSFRPAGDNPFERLVDQACFVISESLRIITAGNDAGASMTRVFSFSGEQADAEFNLRLGNALLVYAESVQNSSLTGIGRSLILSVLSMGDASGMVTAGLSISEKAELVESTARLTSARLYRILNPVNPFPRAVILGTQANGLWAWTAAQAINVNQQDDTIDITVSFPASETHYMLIRGVKPFARIQLYGMDFRSDPQFERYDSSGWVYYSQEQVLVLKMRHRTAEERIRIIFREEARPAPRTETAPAAAPAAPVRTETPPPQTPAQPARTEAAPEAAATQPPAVTQPPAPPPPAAAPPPAAYNVWDGYFDP